jgi:hypothetical protein
MPKPATTIVLPKDLQAFAEERGRDALEENKLAALREALDAGLAGLDAGLGVKGSVEDFMFDIDAEAGITPNI